MATPYFRAMATCSMLKEQLDKEVRSRKAMELCFKKIHQSLDLYKGHYINRLLFHMNRHHTEYLRKVRMQEKKAPKQPNPRARLPERRSERVSQIEELTAKLDEAKRLIKEQNSTIETMSQLLDGVDRVDEVDQFFSDGPLIGP